MRWLAITLALAFPLAVCSDEVFRDEFLSVDDWTPMPDWLGAPSDHAVAEAAEGIARFAVAEADRGMKWHRVIEEVDTDLTPWLVIRYRAENLASEKIDYLLWLRDGDRTRDGVRLIRGDAVRADGQWHTQAFDLAQAGVASPVSGLAIGIFATEAGNAALWVDYVAFTDAPPPEAEGYMPPTREGAMYNVAMDDPQLWTVQPTWLANYSEANSCDRTPQGTVFIVGEAGKGAKWSRNLPEPITGARWVAMRYRATGLIGQGGDYALYLGSEAGGRAHEEQYAIAQGDLLCDNGWHVAVARVTVSSIKTLAVQVQALREEARLEISGLRFSERRPLVRLQEAFPHERGWPAEMDGFRPLLLPPGNTEGPALSHRLGWEGWIEGERITAGGLPFSIRPGVNAVLMTSTAELGEITMTLSGTAAELYLILAAQLPSREEPSFGGGAMQGIRQVERFVAQVDYADGTSEEQFPLMVSAGTHRVIPGLAVYALALDPTRELARLVLRDGMRRGAFGLVAATLSDTPGPASEATAPRPALQVAPPRPLAARPPRIARHGNVVTIEARSIGMTLDCTRGLRVSAIQNYSRQPAALTFLPGPLFRIESGDLRLTSEDFLTRRIAEAATGRGSRVTIELVCDQVTPPISMALTVDTSTQDEITLQADCDLGGRDHKATHLVFPELQGLRFGPEPEDTWYWMPRRGAVINTLPITLRAPYGGEMPMQIVGVFGPRLGTGLYVMTQDLEAAPRYYLVDKSGGEVRLGVEYHPYAGQRVPPTVIGCVQGDWHEQLARYRKWLATWYKPAAPRKQWFREVFNFRQQFLHFAVPTNSGMFDPQSKSFRLKEVVEKDAEAFGGVDYLHIFDWGWDPVHGRCGDYVPWDYLGGADNFRRAVQEVKDAGIPVGLYIEGYLVDPESDLGKAHGKEWQLLDAEGKPYPYFAPSFNICPWVKDWQQYLSGTYARAKRETGAVGFYIDEYGFSAPHHSCYNPNHGHEVPVTPVLGERQMTQRVREALGPDCVIYTEETPSDVTSQYQDGSFTYNIVSVPDQWSPTHLNLFRFAFPSFKTIEIIACDQPLGSNIEAVKRILFNGEAIWIEGVWDKWFTPELRSYIAKMHDVLRRNRKCFASDFPVPLVPTLVQGVYANMFPEAADGRGKTCWTVYNTNFRSVGGELLRVSHVPGAEYRDEFTGQTIPARVEGDTATLRLRIGPRDVALVSRTTP